MKAASYSTGTPAARYMTTILVQHPRMAFSFYCFFVRYVFDFSAIPNVTNICGFAISSPTVRHVMARIYQPKVLDSRPAPEITSPEPRPSLARTHRTHRHLYLPYRYSRRVPSLNPYWPIATHSRVHSTFSDASSPRCCNQQRFGPCYSRSAR